MAKRVSSIVLSALLLGLASGALAQGMPHRGPMRGAPMTGSCGPGMGMGWGCDGCPMAMAGADLEVKKIENGASITMTSSDPQVAARIQKRAEIMRLMHELQQEEQP